MHKRLQRLEASAQQRLDDAIVRVRERDVRPQFSDDEQVALHAFNQRPDWRTCWLTEEEAALLGKVEMTMCEAWLAAGYWCATGDCGIFFLTLMPPAPDGTPTSPIAGFGRQLRIPPLPPEQLVFRWYAPLREARG